jgi:hypothetical protein
MADDVDASGEDPSEVRVEAIFSYTDSDDVEVTQMFFGMRPAVLITPQRDGTALVLQAKSVDLPPKHLVNLLRMVADAVEKGRKQKKEEKKAKKVSKRLAEEAEASDQSL